MSRYKGRASLKLIESKFPHHVDMMVPEGGFGRLLNAMHDWHDAHGIEAVRGQAGARMGATSFDAALLTWEWRCHFKKNLTKMANCERSSDEAWAV